MTLERALRTGAARRLRPSEYPGIYGQVAAFALGVVLLRIAANLYLCSQLMVTPAAAAGLVAANLAWCVVVSCTLLPVTAWRAHGPLIVSTRLELAPGTRARRIVASLQASLAGPQGVVLAALPVVVCAVLGATLSMPFLSLLAASCLAIVASVIVFGGVLVSLALLGMQGREALAIEAVAFVALVAANPTFDIRDGGPRIEIFNRLHLHLDGDALAAIVIGFGAALLAIALVMRLFAGGRPGPALRRLALRPAMRLYVRNLSIPAVGLSLAVQVAALAAASLSLARTVVLVALGFQGFLALIAVGRAESLLNQRWNAPARFRVRIAIYFRSLLAQAVVSVVPIIALVARSVAGGA